MRKRFVMLLGLLLLPVGCAAPPSAPDQADPTGEDPTAATQPSEPGQSRYGATAKAASGESDDGAAQGGAGGESGTTQNAKPAATDPSGLSPRQLSIWQSAEFQRRFTQSYIAETEIEPRVTGDERQTMQTVLDLISNDKLDQAAKRLRESRGEAATAVYDFTLANIHFQREQWDQAIQYYEVAVEKYPKFRRAWSNLGKIRVRLEQYEPAVKALTRVIELGGNDGVTYGLLGYAQTMTGRHMAAESAYRKAVMLDPDTLDWKLGLARSFFKQQRHAEAAAYCDRLIELEPTRADFWLLQANAYIGLDKPEKAAQNYEMVDRLGESTVASLTTLGDIYVNEALYGLAVDSYARALEMDAEAAIDRAVRAAKVLASRGALDQTDTLVQRIEGAYGDRLAEARRKDLLKLRARIAVSRGAGGKQVEVLKRIIEIDPMDGEALMLLGKHYAREDKLEEAMFYYERAAKIEGHKADAMVRQAELLVQQGKYQKALPLLRNAQKLKHRDNVEQYLQQVEQIARSG